MVNPMPQITTVPADTWFAASWEEFLAFTQDPRLASGRFYYDQGLMKIESSSRIPQGQDNTTIRYTIILYAALNQIPIWTCTNAFLAETPIQEAQPDLAFYIGESYKALPRSNAPVNLDETPPPTLVVEIAATSLQDDLGRKQTLYQRLGVQEYWVVNVNANQVTAFSLIGATEITTSQVLPNLAMTLVEEALRRSQTEDDGAVSRWLLGEFQKP